MYADVHFRIGSTMEDMLECVEAAADKAVELGYADPERIGLMGHSFSGAGAIYTAGKSKKFAAVSAGAGAVDPGGLHHLWGYTSDRKTGGGQNAHQHLARPHVGQGDLFQAIVIWSETHDGPHRCG